MSTIFSPKHDTQRGGRQHDRRRCRTPPWPSWSRRPPASSVAAPTPPSSAPRRSTAGASTTTASSATATQPTPTAHSHARQEGHAGHECRAQTTPSSVRTGTSTWGYNVRQLGNGTLTQESTPVQVSMPSGVIPLSVAAGTDHSMALGSNGTVYAWGHNAFGQLGNGTTTNSPVPTAVSLPAGIPRTPSPPAATSPWRSVRTATSTPGVTAPNGALGNGGTADATRR